MAYNLGLMQQMCVNVHFFAVPFAYSFPQPAMPRWQKYLISFLGSQVFIFGTFLNSATLYIVLKSCHRNALNCNIALLALVDLIISSILVPIYAIIIHFDTLRVKQYWIAIDNCFQIFIVYEIFLVTLMAYERYLVLSRSNPQMPSFNQKMGLKLFFSLAAVGFVCTISFVLCIDLWAGVFGNMQWFRDNAEIQCISSVVVASTISYWLPLVVILVLYSKMSNMLFRSCDLGLSVADQHIFRKRQKTANIVLALALMFAICWLPYQLYGFVKVVSTVKCDVFCPNPNLDVFNLISIWIALIYSCTNPVTLYCMSTCFRRKYGEFFRTVQRKFSCGQRRPLNPAEERF